MAAVLRCECGGKPRYRLTIHDLDLLGIPLGETEVCESCMEGIVLLQPRVAAILRRKGEKHDDSNV